MKHLALALGGAAVLVAATVGFGYAQSAGQQQQQHRAVIDTAAAKLGLTGDQLAQALQQARKDLGLRAAAGVARLGRQELEVAAKSLGLPNAAALRKELAGTTLTAVAQKHNVAPATVAAAITSDVDARIDAAVSAGTLKAERAAALKQRVGARVDAFMNRTFKAAKTSAA